MTASRTGAGDGTGAGAPGASAWPREVLDEIRHRADIAAIAGERVALKRAGSALKGLCPFHDEKTPSFHVNPSRGFFKCFGCGEGGDVFALVMRLDGLTFPEAVRALADRTGVRLPARKEDEGLTNRELTRDLLRRAADYFHRFLFSKDGEEAMAYLKSRGISRESIERFRLGSAPSGRSVLYNKTRGRFPEAVLEASGLFGRGEDGRGWYDRFRGRLVFPVCDASGRVAGFGGRLLEGGKGGKGRKGGDAPKYLNSPETDLFRKGELLYGLHLARDAARKAGRLVLVEGYTDVVLCHQSGIEEVAAPLGTAFTEAQARLAKRYADRVVFALDADPAGEGAANRGIDVALAADLEVRVARFPEGADPADLVAAGRAAEVRAALDGAAEYVGWRLDGAAAAAARAGGTVAARSSAARALVPTIARVADPIARDAHLRATAARLGLDEETLRREVRRAAERGGGEPAAARPAAEPIVKTARPRPFRLDAEAALLRLLLDGGDEVRRLAAAILEPSDFAEPARGRLFAAILDAVAAAEPLAGDLGGRLDEEGTALFAAVATAPGAPPATVAEAAARIERLKDRALEAAIRGAGDDLERVRSGQRARAALKGRVAAAVEGLNDAAEGRRA